ncbi:DNA repair protein RecO [[Mycoplasma] falconis]|uniref:DNA repair protein RecO n=1 Tax=[Mycoplasma] falconis TaxID=92403 RepID=A0A501XA85_9BACT|nr:DNA repair protein RecO [[Mycoplasma] falconis]TPE57442.1 DNA repair protein RecO [[Mycoplasma] falconis]
MWQEIDKKAIILKKTPYYDYDELITCLTNEGIKYYFCKGVRKSSSKNRFALNLLNLVNLTLLYKEDINSNLVLKTATLIKEFNYQSYLSNTYETLIRLFNSLRLNNLDVILSSYEKVLPYFEKRNFVAMSYLCFQVLKVMGLLPQLEHCVECNNRDNIVDFNLYKGGFLCREHSNKQPNLSFLKSIYYLSKSFDDYDLAVSNEEAKTILDLILNFIWQYI